VFCFGVNAAGIVSSAISMVASAVNVASEGGANCFRKYGHKKFGVVWLKSYSTCVMEEMYGDKQFGLTFDVHDG
jgi:hypothetical protein